MEKIIINKKLFNYYVICPYLFQSELKRKRTNKEIEDLKQSKYLHNLFSEVFLYYDKEELNKNKMFEYLTSNMINVVEQIPYVKHFLNYIEHKNFIKPYKINYKLEIPKYNMLCLIDKIDIINNKTYITDYRFSEKQDWDLIKNEMYFCAALYYLKHKHIPDYLEVYFIKDGTYIVQETNMTEVKFIIRKIQELPLQLIDYSYLDSFPTIQSDYCNICKVKQCPVKLRKYNLQKKQIYNEENENFVDEFLQKLQIKDYILHEVTENDL